MTKHLRTAAAVAAMAIWGGSSSIAATVDLTDTSTYSTRTAALASGTLRGGLTWSITSPSGPLTYTAFDGIDSPLRDQLDGIGIKDDEISYLGGVSELLYLQFSAPVRVTGFHFMDLFKEAGALPRQQEMAYVFVGQLGAVGAPTYVFGADEAYAKPASGYAFGKANAKSSIFTFAVSPDNDGIGVPNYSLAGFNVAPIPLPAGILLIGTGLACFGALRFRKPRA